MQNITALSAKSKVWIYQSSKPFTQEEISAINNKLKQFTVQWTAHNKQLLADGHVVYDRFIVLIVDESHTMASGCSIDTSVHFIQELEKEYGINLFDRTLINYELNGSVETVSIDEFRNRYTAGSIQDDVFVFDPLVKDKRSFDNDFKIKLANSWIKNIL